MVDTYQIEGEEVVEREVTPTGNGAHVYLPKEWLKSKVKVVRLAEESEVSSHDCRVCGRTAGDTEKWVWVDESGGAFFEICLDCRSEVEETPSGVCALCHQKGEMYKSTGFGAMGEGETELYQGCDECRAIVTRETDELPNRGWAE
jgi:putative transposon-encoded protein